MMTEIDKVSVRREMSANIIVRLSYFPCSFVVIMDFPRAAGKRLDLIDAIISIRHVFSNMYRPRVRLPFQGRLYGPGRVALATKEHCVLPPIDSSAGKFRTFC